MPLPTPSPKEKSSPKGQAEFVSRCMGNSVMRKDYPEQKQRAAVCYSQWKRAKQKKKSSGSDEDPTWDEQEFDSIVVIY